MTKQVTENNSGILRWKPLAKGKVQECVCTLEGCCTIVTVLNMEENILEIYQCNAHSIHSCIARIVLPDNVALCKLDESQAA